MTQAEEHEGPVIRDRRRIDPETGRLRANPPAAAAAGQVPPEGADADTSGTVADQEDTRVAELQQSVLERTNDLKRLQAEYVNYKRRVDRDREAVRDLAVGSVLTELLPVVDDIGRAREHGELEGGFKAVAEALESVLAKLGLQRFGEVGEPFDPRIHEALMHAYAEDVDGPTCSAILQPGYRQGERVLRPARVAVAEPTVGLAPAAEGAAEPAASGEPGESGAGDDQPRSSDDE